MITLTWYGPNEDDEGRAIYSIEGSATTFEIWLPSLHKAHHIELMLRDAYNEGRENGRREVIRCVTDAIDGVRSM